jgi:hypothetical protein
VQGSALVLLSWLLGNYLGWNLLCHIMIRNAAL